MNAEKNILPGMNANAVRFVELVENHVTGVWGACFDVFAPMTLTEFDRVWKDVCAIMKAKGLNAKSIGVYCSRIRKIKGAGKELPQDHAEAVKLYDSLPKTKKAKKGETPKPEAKDNSEDSSSDGDGAERRIADAVNSAKKATRLYTLIGRAMSTYGISEDVLIAAVEAVIAEAAERDAQETHDEMEAEAAEPLAA